MTLSARAIAAPASSGGGKNRVLCTDMLTGLFLLSTRLTDDNAARLLAEARGKTRREIEAIIARWFPRPDVLPSVTPMSAAANDVSVTIPGNGSSPAGVPNERAEPPLPFRARMEPLSASSYRIEFTASAALNDKIEQARNLLSHAIPTGDLAQLFERALDTLLQVESKRRLGTGQPRRRRQLGPGSRHVPRDVARAVWERDGARCTFTDALGRRCDERRFTTIEHREPFARGGPATIENLCLLCSAHNAERRARSLERLSWKTGVAKLWRTTRRCERSSGSASSGGAHGTRS